jgi:hypothetical protein
MTAPRPPTLVLLACLCCTRAPRPPVSQRALPTGSGVVGPISTWARQAPDAVDWEGAGSSKHDWHVAIEAGRLRIDEEEGEHVDALPFEPQPITEHGQLELAGTRHVVAVTGGFLVGFDAGEFGGGPWWFSADGTRRRKLTLRGISHNHVAENVHEFVALAGDFLAFEGLNHLGGNDGQVVRLHLGPDGDWQPSLFAALNSCAQAVVQESKTTWLLATTTGIWRLDAQARVQPVWQSRGKYLYHPSSIARDAAGIVYMGMRGAIVQMTPRPGSAYAVDVLVPSE